MKLGEYISVLQKLEEEHGPDIEVCVYPYDGQMFPKPCGEPTLCYTEKDMKELQITYPTWELPYPGPVIVTDTE